MRDEIPSCIAEYLRQSDFVVHYEIGATVTVLFDGCYVSVIVWYNPEASVSMDASGGLHLASLPLSRPDALEQMVKILSDFRDR